MESIEAPEQHEEEEDVDVVIANHEYGFESVASYQDNLNSLNEKHPIGSLDSDVAAVDSTLLKRSVSMPPQYEYHNQTKRKIFGVKEVIQDHPPKDEALQASEDKETEDEVGELKLSMATPAKRKWQQTMPDLIEGPESETLTSQSSGRHLLAKAALAIVRGDYDVKTELADVEEMDELEQMEFEKLERRKYMKNLLILCLSFFFVFMPYLSLRNLQSSLNAAGGLGLYSLSCLYACFFVGCIFATTLVQRLRPKWTMLMCMCTMFLFDLVNFHPTFYTLIPMSGVVGFALGVIWTAHATYLTNIAASYAILTEKKIQEVLLRFNSIHFVFYQSAQIVGGLVSSAVLNNSGSGAPSLNDTFPTFHNNESFSGVNGTEFELFNYTVYTTTHDALELEVLDELRCGTSYCPGGYGGPTSKQEISMGMVYMLVGIFTGCTFVGILIMFLFLDRLEGVMKKSHATLGKQLGAVFRFYADRRVVCLIGIMFYSMLQSSFMFGEYTKVCELFMYNYFIYMSYLYVILICHILVRSDVQIFGQYPIWTMSKCLDTGLLTSLTSRFNIIYMGIRLTQSIIRITDGY